MLRGVSRYLDLQISMLTNIKIFTGCLPFYEILRECTVIFKVSKGHRPSRPPATSDAWTSWGLTETIWELMENCWKPKPGERPVVEETTARMNSVGRVDDRPTSGWMTDMSPSYFRNVVSRSQYHPSLDHIDVVFSDFKFA